FEHGYCGMRFSCLMDTILHTCAQAKKEKKYIPPVYHSTLPKLTHYKIVKKFVDFQIRIMVKNNRLVIITGN
ncbi:MAG: hypothetical protein NTX71_02390, partial [Candidatus Aureabacteria bacterium]|nr:hypothetical protein [Candidatus Auribacterota bacterium]